MAYQLISVKCPECGQTLTIEENRTQAFCTYCGARVLISNENEFVFRQVDEADIRKAETERIIRLRELEIAEKNNRFRKILSTVWLIVTLILLVIAVVLMLSPGDHGFQFLFYVCVPIIGGGAYLIFKWLPEKENEKIIVRHGGIRFPDGLSPFSEKRYTAVRETLWSAGFQNVVCINLHDLNLLTAMVNSDKIEKITVDGNTITSGGKYYMPDVPIVITYHGR